MREVPRSLGWEVPSFALEKSVGKAGIAEPTPDWTLDQMVEAAKKVQQSASWPAEFYPVGYSWGGFEQLVGNIRRFNGEVLDPANGPGSKSLMDSAPAVQMAKWFYDNIKSKLFSPRTYGAKEFGEGKLAFYFGRLAGERGAVNNAAGITNASGTSRYMYLLGRTTKPTVGQTIVTESTTNATGVRKIVSRLPNAVSPGRSTRVSAQATTARRKASAMSR